MEKKTLGRLERIELRNIWASESTEFTPWLARPENLEILGETLGLELELEAQEKFVGQFRADILCKDIGNDHWVLIENQLERTDHVHLGQLLTYAAGLQAVTIIWIAANFNDQHRATLDWLNKITDDSFRFFGLEVELWRIGDSPAAPRFNVVSKPNNWSQSVRQAAKALDDVELSDIRVQQREYWAALNSILAAKAGPVAGNKKPQPQSWMGYPIGRSFCHLGAVWISQKNRIRAELYIRGSNAKAFFRELVEQRSEIEKELGFPLEWEELPEGQDSRISVYLEGANPRDETDWTRQQEWLATKLNEMHRVLAPRVKDLNSDTFKFDD